MADFFILAATLLPLLSSIDPDSNALLALRQNNFNQESDDTDKDLIGRGKPGGAVELFKKDDEEDQFEDDDDENIDDTLEDDKLKVTVNSRAVEIDLEDLYDGSSVTDVGQVKESDMHKVSKSVLSQVSAKYTHMFKRLLSEGKGGDGKIIYLRDYGGMQDAFTRIMLKSLVVAVEDLKQKGHRLMIMASHCQGTESEDEYIPVISNMRRFSVLPPLQNEDQLAQWKSVMKLDENRRITEINAKQLLAMYSQKNVLGIKTDRQGDLLQDLLSINTSDISKSIWSPSEVDRRVTTAIGHALENNKTKLDISDFKVANDIVRQVSDMKDASSKKLNIATTAAKVHRDGSLDLDYLKRSCNEYERKLLSRVVDPCKNIYSYFFKQ